MKKFKINPPSKEVLRSMVKDKWKPIVSVDLHAIVGRRDMRICHFIGEFTFEGKVFIHFN